MSFGPWIVQQQLTVLRDPQITVYAACTLNAPLLLIIRAWEKRASLFGQGKYSRIQRMIQRVLISTTAHQPLKIVFDLPPDLIVRFCISPESLTPNLAADALPSRRYAVGRHPAERPIVGLRDGLGRLGPPRSDKVARATEKRRRRVCTQASRRLAAEPAHAHVRQEQRGRRDARQAHGQDRGRPRADRGGHQDDGVKRYGDPKAGLKGSQYISQLSGAYTLQHACGEMRISLLCSKIAGLC